MGSPMFPRSAHSGLGDLRYSAQTRLTWLSLHPDSFAVREILLPPILRVTILSCVALSLVRLSPDVFSPCLCLVDALALAFPTILEIVTSHLQRQLQKHFLNGVEGDLGNPFSAGGWNSEIHQAGNGEPRPFAPDRGNELFRLWQGRRLMRSIFSAITTSPG